jgi:site-specific DNA recombinase
MPTAAIYTRISREDQSTYSLATQEAACRQLAEREGLDVREVFTDDGYSSERLDRLGLERLRDLVRAQAVAAIVCHSPDRLTRKAGHLYILEEEFRRHQVRLLYCTSTADDTPEGRLTGHIRAAISEFELETLRERTRRGRRARALAGLPQLGYGVPYGYKYNPVSNTSRGELVVDPSEASIVQEIFQLRLQGLGAWRLSRLLTARGVPTKHNKPSWTVSTLIGMLRSRVYIGEAFYNKSHYTDPPDNSRRRKPSVKRTKTTRVKHAHEDWIPVQVPAIIDKATFDAVQDILTHSASTNPRNRKYTYMYTNARLRCSCGRVMSGFYETRRNEWYYRCSRRDSPKCGRMVTASWIEEQGWNVIQALMELDPVYIRMELQRRRQPPKYRPSDLEALEQRIHEADARIQRWRDAYEKSVITLDDFAERQASINQEIESLRRTHQEVAEDVNLQHRQEDDIEAAVDFLSRARDDISAYGPEDRARVAQLLNLRVVYESREKWSSSFFVPAEWGVDLSTMSAG